MKLDNKGLHEFLTEKGVLYLFHANTVASSISFILAGGLLSRGDVEKRNIFQTPQASDHKDKLFDVWNDIFLDAEDLHAKFNRNNKYGPVLFKFSIDFLLDDDLEIWITKSNPIDWAEKLRESDRYYTNVAQYAADWGGENSQRRMITVRKPHSPALFPSLEEIILDTSAGKVYEGYEFEAIDTASIAAHALKSATETHRGLRSMITLRACNAKCYCAENYSREIDDSELAKLFLPRDLIYSA